MFTEGLDARVQELADKTAKATEACILAQLNDFIKRGLIDIEATQPTFVMDALTNEVQVRRTVKLHLRDKAYIERLEKENAELKQFKETIKAAYGETKG